MKTNKLLLLIIFFPLVAGSQSWSPEQMIRFRRITSAVISPDGKRVAYTVSVPLLDGEKSEYLTNVWMAMTDGSMNRQFTFGDKSCSNIRFSPDNRYLSFTSARKEKTQLYLMVVDGGEAEAITNQKNNIGSYAWSPDGSRIAFLMADTLTEKEEKDKKEKRDMEVVDQQYKNSHLYVIILQKNTKGEYPVKQITSGDFHITDLNWSPDSKMIVFSHQASPSADIWSTSDISCVSTDGGAIKLLVNNKGQDNNPKYSPDGLLIAFKSDGGKASWAGRSDIYIIPSNGGSPMKLAVTFDQNPELIEWNPDGKSVLIAESYKTSRILYTLPVDGKNPKRLLAPSQGIISSISFSKKGDPFACISQNVSTPPQVILFSLTDPKMIKLSDINDDFIKMNHSITEIISWKSKDGKYEIEGLVTYPKDFRKDRKYPLILNIHGGPAGVFNQAYTGSGAVYPLQAFADQGYVILRPNPRGSGGYGADFRYANHNDWGFGDYDDIMAGVDLLVARNIAHPDSLCVTGWSYGGYMTSMIITKTNRFKAAVVGAGVTNLMSFTGTSDIPGFLPDYFDVEMYESTDVYMKHSAMFGVKNVKTPTLIIHGTNDLRVPISQGQELYGALKRMGVKTEMVVYPRTLHGPEEPKFIQDIGERVIDWFDSCLGRKK